MATSIDAYMNTMKKKAGDLTTQVAKSSNSMGTALQGTGNKATGTAITAGVNGTVNYVIPENAGQLTQKKATGSGGKAKPVNPYDQQVADAKTAYEKAAGGMPGAYESTWQGQIDSLLNGILNREKFSYNQDADPMYRLYRDSYVTQGRNAMRDTMGQATALSGGYGSSYAQTAGQQAYQNHLQQLHSTVQPQLYNMALAAWNAENDAANNRLAALQQAENAAYNRWSDDYSRALQERSWTYDVLQDLLNRQKAWKG